MKVLLLEIKPKNERKTINKDLAGGMGTGTWVGDSFLARIFEYTKKKSVVLPNITVAYLKAIFRQFGWEAEFEEIEADDITKIKEADLILVQTSIVDSRNELEAIKKLKQRNFSVGVYGTFASAVPEFFAAAADFVIKGEAEADVLKIAKEKKIPKGILEVDPIEDLDSLPFPDWSGFPVKKYSYFPALNKKPVLTMLASRGCPYSCSFYCPYTIAAGRKWRARSIENILGEIEHLKKNYQIKAIDFRDAIFTLDREKTIELAKKIIEKDLNIIWSCETRLDRLDKELIDIMRQAGLRHINVGIESSDKNILKNNSRLPIEYAHQEEIIAYCRKKGISIAAFYILGLDSDTKESVKRTIGYARKLNTLVAQFTIATPYPGTPFFEQAKKEGKILNFDWENYDAYTPVLKNEFLTQKELVGLKEKAFVSYYFGPAYLFRHLPRILIKKFL